LSAVFRQYQLRCKMREVRIFGIANRVGHAALGMLAQNPGDLFRTIDLAFTQNTLDGILRAAGSLICVDRIVMNDHDRVPATSWHLALDDSRKHWFDG